MGILTNNSSQDLGKNIFMYIFAHILRTRVDLYLPKNRFWNFNFMKFDRHNHCVCQSD